MVQVGCKHSLLNYRFVQQHRFFLPVFSRAQVREDCKWRSIRCHMLPNQPSQNSECLLHHGLPSVYEPMHMRRLFRGADCMLQSHQMTTPLSMYFDAGAWDRTSALRSVHACTSAQPQRPTPWCRLAVVSVVELSTYMHQLVFRFTHTCAYSRLQESSISETPTARSTMDWPVARRCCKARLRIQYNVA